MKDSTLCSCILRWWSCEHLACLKSYWLVQLLFCYKSTGWMVFLRSSHLWNPCALLLIFSFYSSPVLHSLSYFFAFVQLHYLKTLSIWSLERPVLFEIEDMFQLCSTLSLIAILVISSLICSSSALIRA